MMRRLSQHSPSLSTPQYSDAQYLATLISATTDCFTHSAEGAEPEDGSELFGTYLRDQGLNEDSAQSRRLWAMMKELDRCLVMDRLVPSYRNLVTMSVVEVSVL